MSPSIHQQQYTYLIHQLENWIYLMAQGGIHLLAVVLATFVCVGHARAPQEFTAVESAQIAEFPYQVFLDIPHGGLCGGAILDSMHILTAAHCLYLHGPRVAAEDIVVITGTNDLLYRPNENVFHVVEATHHPNFNTNGHDNDDIAILKVDREMSFNHYRQPAKLPKNDTQAGTQLTFSGWAEIDSTDFRSNYLKKLKQVVLSQEECDDWYSVEYYTSRICAWTSEGVNLCKGDGGSLLSSDGVVFGIDAERGCRYFHYPVKYTPVYKYLDWIKRIMRTRQSNIWPN